MLLVIRDVLPNESWDMHELLNELANVMHVKFKKYRKNPNIALPIAIVLDPCMKADFIKLCLFTVGEDVEVEMKGLKQLKKYYL